MTNEQMFGIITYSESEVAIIMAYKCCFTGYRPSKMPFNLDEENEEYKNFENCLIEEILNLINEGCRTFYSGMALGFDIIAAETILLLKEAYKNIELVCVLPFETQAESYSDSWKERYFSILEKCDRKIVLSDEYFKGCYQRRNEFMVDNCDFVLTWYDGKAGGTRNTLNYATKKQRHIVNVNKSEIETFAVQTEFELI